MMQMNTKIAPRLTPFFSGTQFNDDAYQLRFAKICKGIERKMKSTEKILESDIMSLRMKMEENDLSEAGKITIRLK